MNSEAVGGETRVFIRYLMVGGLNTAFSYLLYLGLLMVLPQWFAYVLAYAAGVGTQYFLLSRIAFRREGSASHLLTYPILHLWIAAFGSTMLILAAQLFGWSAALSGLFAILCQVPVGFLLTRWWFREDEAPERAREWSRLAICAILIGFSAMFLLSTLLAIVNMGFRVPLWDQFRSYNILLSMDFPSNILHVEAGHRPVFPNMLKVLDFWLTGGSQELLLGAGASFAVIFWTLLCKAILGNSARISLAHCALILVLSATTFWLANARMLLHGNEAVAVYWVLAWLAVGLIAFPRFADSGKGGVVFLSMFMACFGFGNGAVVGCTLLVIAVLYGVHWRDFLKLLAGFVAILLLYLSAVPGDSSPSLGAEVKPVEMLLVACRWLAGFWVQAWAGLADDTNGFLRASLASRDSGAWLVDSADWVAGWFAEPRHMVMYLSLRIGAVGVVWLLILSFVVWLRNGRGVLRLGDQSEASPSLSHVARGDQSDLSRIGLGLSWFGFGTALLIGLSRADYFLIYPEQIFAERYLPWLCVFWLGLIMATSGFFCRRFPRAVATLSSMLAVLVAIVLWQSHLVWAGWGKEVSRRALIMNEALSQGVVVKDLDRALAIPDEIDTSVALKRMVTHGATVYQFACPPRSEAVAKEPGRVSAVRWVDDDFATQNEQLRRWTGVIDPTTRSALRMWIYDAAGRCVGGGVLSQHDRTSQQWLLGRRNRLEGFVQRHSSVQIEPQKLEFQLWQAQELLDRTTLD
ncbi:MAG: GtrA family protein [Xanthomonadales bacterium]|jgi:putative flippase GtrA|nr:GtrA family protein [Xanthomonadales bacterium]